MNRFSLLVVFQLVMASLAVGCGGSSRPPTQLLSETQASIRGAEEVGAADAPKAALHLKMARDYVARAEQLMQDDENDTAGYLLMRASADAELSIAFAKSSRERTDVEETQNKIERLKEGQK